MITVNKANPTQGEITSSLTGSTGDGAGLHFDGAGNISFTPVDLGSKFSHEFIIKADEDLTTGSSSYLIDYEGGGGRFVIGAEPTQASGNLAIYDDVGWKSFGVNPLTDLKVHHIVVTVDETSAVLYDNGNQVGTVTINANHGIDNATAAAIGSNFFTATSNNFEGVIYRCRTYNKALTSAEVQTAYERADVDYADQYGSQTDYHTHSNAVSDHSTEANATTGWAANNSPITSQTTVKNVGSYAFKIDYNAGTNAPRASYAFSGKSTGKKYRLQFDYKHSGTGDSVVAGFGHDTYGGVNIVHTITASETSWTTKVYEFEDDGTNYAKFALRIASTSASATTIYIDNFFLVQIGCVSDYDLAFANPTQSLTVQDRAGSADGTCSSSGVTQVQPVVQLNSTSARIGTSTATPADGDLVVSGMIGVGNTPSQKLTVDDSANDMQMRIGSLTNGIDPFVRFQGSASDGTRAYSDFGVDAANQNFYVKAPKSTTPTITALTIDSSGNVSVGGSAATRLLTLKKDGGGSQLGLDIHNTGTATGDDAVVSYECQGVAEWMTGVDRSASSFVIAGPGQDLATNPRLTINSTGDVTVNESLSIGTTPTSGISLNVRENSTTTAADIRNANASGFGLYVAGGSSSSEYAFRAANKDNTALFTVKGDGLAEFANDVAYDDNARVYHGNLPSTGPSHSSHDKYNFNFTFSGTYGVALITFDIAAGIGEVAAGRYTLAVSCTANSGVTTQLMGSVTEVFKHNLSALTFADSGSSNRTFTLSVERTVTAENWGTNTGSYKLEVTNNHRTLTLNSVTAST